MVIFGETGRRGETGEFQNSDMTLQYTIETPKFDLKSLILTYLAQYQQIPPRNVYFPSKDLEW